jgi:hypothetical protein
MVIRPLDRAAGGSIVRLTRRRAASTPQKRSKGRDAAVLRERAGMVAQREDLRDAIASSTARSSAPWSRASQASQ